MGRASGPTVSDVEHAGLSLGDTGDLHDVALRLSRGLLYLGLFGSSLLVARAGTLTFGDILIVSSLLLFLVARSANPGASWPNASASFSSTATLLLLFLITSLFAIFNAADAADSLLVILRILVVAFVLPWLTRMLLPTWAHLKTATIWLFAGAATSASGTLLQFALGAGVIPGAAVTDAGRFSGFTGHVSDLGGIAALAATLGIGFVLSTRGRARLISLAAFAGSVVGLILSGSVSGMIAATVGLLVYMGRRAIRVGSVILLAIAGVAIAAISGSIRAGVSGLDPYQRLMQTLGLTNGGRYSTSESRLETYEMAFKRIGENPFFGSGFDAVSALADGRFPPHNIIVGAAFQGGIILALVLGLLLFRPFLGKWIRRDRSMLVTQLTAAAGAAIVFAMTAPSLFNRYLWFPIALLMVARGLATLATSRDSGPSQSLTQPQSRSRHPSRGSYPRATLPR